MPSAPISTAFFAKSTFCRGDYADMLLWTVSDHLQDNQTNSEKQRLGNAHRKPTAFLALCV